MKLKFQYLPIYLLFGIFLISNIYQFSEILAYFRIMKAHEKKHLTDYFKDSKSFSRKDLQQYFARTEGEIKEGTLGWRIYDLKKKNVIREVKRGFYTLDTKPVYIPVIDDTLIKLSEIFTASYHKAAYCLWNIDWLNEFTIHQFRRDNVIFEIEKDLVESMANKLLEQGYTSIINNIQGILLSFTSPVIPIIFQPLISRAPVQKSNSSGDVSVSVPTLEKILVDIYANGNIFQFVQGSELQNIFTHAIDRYSINYTTLFGYAKRRGKERDLRAFIKRLLPEDLKTITQ